MQLAVNVAVLASLYALIACGYVLIYRVSRVLSLAHGELMMLGAYGLFATASFFPGHPALAIGVEERSRGRAEPDTIIGSMSLFGLDDRRKRRDPL